MFAALLYLRLTSFRNWLVTRLKSLRRPKQLAGALMFALYFWFFFLRHWTASSPRSPPGAANRAWLAPQVSGALPGDLLPVATAFGATALLALALLMWILPRKRAALGFTEAEIAFLFPAPVPRRTLVHFRLISSQFRSLLGAVVMMLISNRWTFLGGSALTHAAGWWFAFSTLSLHHSGAGFALTRLADAGLPVARRRVLILAIASVAIGITMWRLPAGVRVPEMTAPGAWDAFATWLVALTNTAPLGLLLWPFKLVLAPFLAPDGRAFALALGPALLVVVAHYLWVVRTAVAFEEASIEHAQKVGARVAAWRAGRARLGDAPAKARPEPFRLHDTGRVELAFLWKNLLSTWPYFNVRVFLGCAAAIVAAVAWLQQSEAWRNFLTPLWAMAAGFGVYALIIGPQFARQDIRSDLAHADILKTYPLPGWQIVLGELLAPAAILTGIVWLALLAAALAFEPPGADLAGFTWSARLACAVWLALITPILVTFQLLVPNAAALLFPAWFHASRAHGGGPELAGQRMIFFFAQMLTMLIALIPPAALGAVLLFVSLRLFDLTLAVAVTLAAFPFLALLLAEVWCGVWLLGKRFEHFDLSVESRA